MSVHPPRSSWPVGHTAERRDLPLAGGEAEGWYAQPLDADSPSPLSWTVDSIARYLKSEIAVRHALLGGPMQGEGADPADVRAIAVYVAAQMGARRQRSAALEPRQLRRAERPLTAPSATVAQGKLRGDAALGAAE